MTYLAGKRALVTGASSGIGAVMAEELPTRVVEAIVRRAMPSREGYAKGP